jgi:UDP-N-acetylglucosamine 4-epimerase
MLRGEPVSIYGDGETSRDFCYVVNAVQANLRAAVATDPAALNQVYNVAVGDRTTLNELHRVLVELLRERRPELRISAPVHETFRPGDVRHSQADVGKARRLLGYVPAHNLRAGLGEALSWYIARFAPEAKEAVAEARGAA